MLAARVAVALLSVLGVGGSAGDEGGDDRVSLQAVALEEAGIAMAPVLDRLADGDVLDVTVTDGVADTRGTVRQCVRTLGGATGCVNAFPVQFGDRGDARFQYRLVDTGRCGPAGSCVLVVDDADGTRRALAHTVFGAPAPPAPVVTISPAGPFEQGAEVRVDIDTLAPGARIQVGYCDPECGLFTRVVADPQGRVTTSVVIGPDCERCGIAVIGGSHASLTAVPFAPSRQPGYETRRLTIGLLVAAALLVAAWRIVATVDWRPPSEAATPELDAVEL